jgi:hypothetical protein
MAVTIQQNPQAFTTASNPVVFTFESDETAQANFSYIVELYIDGALHSTHQVFPQFGELAKFNASEAVRSTLASPLITNGSLTTNYNTAISTVYIIVSEKYGTPPAIQLDATSNAIFVFNGALRHPDWIDFSFKDYDVSTTNNLTPGVKFLTSWPRARKTFCGMNEKIFLGFISSDTSFNVRFTLRTAGGALIVTDLVSLSFNDLTVVDCSPSTIMANTTITALDFASAAYYEVIARGAGTGIFNGSSETFQIYIDTECHRYETRRLHWLNKFGVWDAFTFTLVSIDSTKVSSTGYNRESGVWDGTAYTYPFYQGQATTYAKTAKDTLILNSDWINEEVQKWLVRELYESPNVYLEQGENFEPVNVVNQNYDFKQRRINGLIQEVVQIERTYLYNSQLN